MTSGTGSSPSPDIFVWMFINRVCFKVFQFVHISRKAMILTTGIHGVFRGLKFEPDAEIGQTGHFEIDSLKFTNISECLSQFPLHERIQLDQGLSYRRRSNNPHIVKGEFVPSNKFGYRIKCNGV